MSKFQADAVELDGCKVKPVHGDYYVFFVDLIDRDGGRLGMWTGNSYEDAIREAEALRMDFGIERPVHDIVGDGAA